MLPKNFINSIHLVVISELAPFLDEHPTLKNILEKSYNSSEDWDLYMTVAGVGNYILTKNVSGDAKLYNIIIKELNEFDKNATKALEGLLDFINTVHGDRVKAMGAWVLWSIKKDKLNDEESDELAPVLGLFLQKLIEDLPKSEEAGVKPKAKTKSQILNITLKISAIIGIFVIAGFICYYFFSYIPNNQRKLEAKRNECLAMAEKIYDEKMGKKANRYDNYLQIVTILKNDRNQSRNECYK